MARTVITGAAGAQGGAIAQAFAEAGYEVVGLTRAASPSRPDLVVVSMENEDALARALDGADVLAFTSPIDHRPGARQGLAERLAHAASLAGVGRIVLNTAAAVPPDLRRPVAEVLRRVRATILGGTVPATVVEPTAYMENLSTPWMADAVAGGVLAYPAPRAARISWISHRTLGEAVVAASRSAAAVGRVFEVGGPEALTGDEVAQRLSEAVGRPVRYEEAALEDFAAVLNAASGAPAGDDIADYYRHLRDHPDELARDGAVMADLGVSPEPMAIWAARQPWPKRGS